MKTFAAFCIVCAVRHYLGWGAWPFYVCALLFIGEQAVYWGRGGDE